MFFITQDIVWGKAMQEPGRRLAAGRIGAKEDCYNELAEVGTGGS